MLARVVVCWLALFPALAFAQQPMLPGFPPGVFQSRAALTPQPTGGGCAQATTFLARTSGLSGTESGAYTTMICGMVADGTITGNLSTTGCGTLFDRIFIGATNTSATASLDICGSTGTPNGAPTFTADAGFTGVDNSSTVFFDTGFNPSTATSPNFTLNSGHLSCWILSGTAQIGPCAGLRSAAGSDDTLVYPEFNGTGTTFGRINESNATSGFTVTGAPQGWFLGNRSGASASQIYRNGTLVASPNVTSTAVPNGGNIAWLAFLNASTSGIQGSGYLQAAMTIGGSLNGTQAASVYSRICTFLTTVHGSC